MGMAPRDEAILKISIIGSILALSMFGAGRIAANFNNSASLKHDRQQESHNNMLEPFKKKQIFMHNMIKITSPLLFMKIKILIYTFN